MADNSVSNVSISVHSGISSEKRDEIIAEACAQIKAAPGSFDTLQAAAQEVGRLIPGADNFAKYYGLDIDRDLLKAALAAGFNEAGALGVIQGGLAKGAVDRKAAEAARPENVENRAACAEIRDNRSLDHVRSTVYALVKKHGLKPEQIDRGAIIKAMGLGATDDTKDVQIAIDQGIQAATAKWEDDTPEMAGIRANPTPGQVLGVVDKAARPESRYVEVAIWERAINAALLEKDGIVALPEFAIDLAVERECETLKKNPTLAQLKISTLRVARRDDDIVLDTFQRLIAAMGSPHVPVPAPVIQPDTVLTVPATEPEAPEGPKMESSVKVVHSEPVDDFVPLDGWPASGRTEKLLPDENGVIHAGAEPGTVRDFSDTGSRTFTPPAALAEPSTRATKLGEWDGGTIARKINSDNRIAKKHDSLAERRGIKRGA